MGKVVSNCIDTIWIVSNDWFVRNPSLFGSSFRWNLRKYDNDDDSIHPSKHSSDDDDDDDYYYQTSERSVKSDGLFHSVKFFVSTPFPVLLLRHRHRHHHLQCHKN